MTKGMQGAHYREQLAAADAAPATVRLTMDERKRIDDWLRGRGLITTRYRGRWRKVLVRRRGWHWPETATLLKTTTNGWRVRFESGPRAGKTVNLTRRCWVVSPLTNEGKNQ
jgi:hypothetical protein